MSRNVEEKDQGAETDLKGYKEEILPVKFLPCIP